MRWRRRDSLIEISQARQASRRVLDAGRVRRLAEYNAEVERGIVHTPEYDSFMHAEQIRFNGIEHDRLLDEGYELVKTFPDGPTLWAKPEHIVKQGRP